MTRNFSNSPNLRVDAQLAARFGWSARSATPRSRVDGQWLYGTGGATKAGISGADALRYEHGILHGDEWAGHGIGSASL